MLKKISQVQKKIKAEQHDHGTIDEVLGDQDMQEEGDVLDEAVREADLLEQIPLPGHRIRERTSSNLASSSSPCPRCDQTTTLKLAASTERSTRADVTCCPSPTRLYQCCQDLRMPGMRQQEAETSNTQNFHHLDPIRINHEVEVVALLDLECCLYGNHMRSSMDCERVRDTWFSVITWVFVSLRA